MTMTRTLLLALVMLVSVGCKHSKSRLIDGEAGCRMNQQGQCVPDVTAQGSDSLSTVQGGN